MVPENTTSRSKLTIILKQTLIAYKQQLFHVIN